MIWLFTQTTSRLEISQVSSRLIISSSTVAEIQPQQGQDSPVCFRSAQSLRLQISSGDYSGEGTRQQTVRDDSPLGSVLS